MTSITPSTLQVDEGDLLTTSLSGFAPGTNLYFKVSGMGINKKDFSAGRVKGRVRVDGNGVATITHTLRADKNTEGKESFAIQLFSDKKMRNPLGQSDAVTVFDASVKAGKGGRNGESGSVGGKDPVTGMYFEVTGNKGTEKIFSGKVDGASKKYRSPSFLLPYIEQTSLYDSVIRLAPYIEEQSLYDSVIRIEMARTSNESSSSESLIFKYNLDGTRINLRVNDASMSSQSIALGPGHISICLGSPGILRPAFRNLFYNCFTFTPGFGFHFSYGPILEALD